MILDTMTDTAARDLIRAYKKSLDAVQKELSVFVIKYSGKTGEMTYAEAVKYNRLVTLEKQIVKELRSLGKIQITTTNQHLSKIYTESFYRSAFTVDNIIRREHQMYLQFGLLPKEQINAAVMNTLYPITTWDKRLIGHIGMMEANIKDSIVRGLIRGISYPEMAREVKDYFERGAWQAERVIRTEAHRVREKGALDSYLQAEAEGVELKKKWLATLDERTRDNHGSADGQEVLNKEPFTVGGEELMYPGDPSGSAGNVINCRCSMEPVVGDFKPKVRRERLTDEEYNYLKEQAAPGEKVPRSQVVPYRSYNEWATAKGLK